MTCCSCLTRSGLSLINLLFCAIGAALVFLGAYIFAECARYGHGGVLSLGTALLPALILIVVGTTALMLGVIGCVVACSEQKCLTGLYFTMLLLLLAGLIVGGVLSFFYRKQIDTKLHEILSDYLKKYGDDKVIQDEVDVIQSQLNCCGVDNSTDWLSTPWHRNTSLPYPQSCCKQNNCTYDEPDTGLNDKGCYEMVKEQFKSNMLLITCLAAGFGVVLLVGMILSCVLFVQKRRSQEYPYIGLPDHDGMRI